MRNISKMLSSLFHKEGWKYVILAVLNYAVIVISYARSFQKLWEQTPSMFIPMNENIQSLFVIALFTVMILQIRRILKFHVQGNQRILLLPQQRMVYFYSELLFVFTTLCLQLLAFALAYCTCYLIQMQGLPPYENAFVYFIQEQPMTSFLFPTEAYGVFHLLLVMFSCALGFTLFAMIRLSFSLMGKLILSSIVLFFPIILLLSLNTHPSLIANTSLAWIKDGILVILDGYLLWLLYHTYGKAKVGD